MAQKVITVKARGLFLNPNDLGDVPDGALLEATNVVIGRDGIIECRRGTQLVNVGFVPVRVWTYKASLIGIDALGVLAYSSDSGFTWTAFATTLTEPTGARMRGTEASGNVYVNASDGIWRFDSLTSEPVAAGEPAAMDARCVISAPSPVDRDGTGVAPDSQTGYRVTFFKRDANLNLIMGAPSQRTVVVNPSINVPAGGVAVDGSHVVTVTSNNHGFTNGQKLQCYSTELDITGGDVKANLVTGYIEVTSTSGIPVLTSGTIGPITVTGPNTFTYTDGNAKISYTTKDITSYASGYRDVIVSATIPPGVDETHYYQGYKTLSSATSTTDPGDEMGLVYEAPVPQIRSVTYLSRTSNVVTATTSAAHGYTPGTVVSLPTTLSGGTGAFVVAHGVSVAASSADGGHTWSSRTNSLATSGPMEYADGRYMVPGTDYISYSTDGVSAWSAVSVKDGANTTYLKQVAFGASTWAAIGYSSGGHFVFRSTDHGATWAKATITDTTGGTGYSYKGLAYGGGTFCVVATGTYSGVTWFVTITSTDGSTWTLNKIMALASATAVPSFLGFGGTNGYFFTMYDATVAGKGAIEWTAPASVANQPWGWSGAYSSTMPPKNSTVPRWLNNAWWVCGSTGAAGQVASKGDYGGWSTQTSVGNGYNMDIAWTGTEYVMVGLGLGSTVTTSAYTSSNGTSWTSRTVPSGKWGGVSSVTMSNDVTVGIYTVQTTPTTTTFTFNSSGGDLTNTAYNHNATPVGVGFLDTVPDTFLGAALYTSPTQETILQSNDIPPASRDVARFRSFLFWAAPTPLTSAPIALISVGGESGVQVGDTVTFNGHSVTASSIENAVSTPPTFKIFTDATRTPAQNIADTVSSLMRVVNVNAGSFTCYLIDTSDRNGVPGQMTIRTTRTATPTTFAFTSTTGKTPWSPASAGSSTYTVNPTTNLNELRYSKANQPDACPETNSLKVGASDKAIVRILATRSSLFIFKEDQIFQLTGYSPPFQVDPFDSTTNIMGPESAVVLDNQVYLLTQNGIQRVSDTGTSLISRPIDPPIAKLLNSANKSQLDKLAFGIAANADHKYYLWLPLALDEGGSVDDEWAMQAFVYDYFTDVFTYRDDASYYGIEIQDDRLLWCGPDGPKLELKTFTSTDLKDDYCTIEGFTNSGSTIDTAVRWVPKFGQDPAALNHFIEVGLLFRDIYFPANTVISFSTSVIGENTWASIALAAANYGMSTSTNPQFAVRALVPPEMRRAGLLNVRLEVPVFCAPMKIQALSVSYNQGPTRFGR